MGFSGSLPKALIFRSASFCTSSPFWAGYRKEIRVEFSWKFGTSVSSGCLTFKMISAEKL